MAIKFINYFQIQEDLQTILVAGPSAGYTVEPTKVFIEAMEREASFDNMPFINIRLVEGEREIRSIPDGYYAHILFEIDIITFNFAEFKDAAKLRDCIMGEAEKAIQENSQFSADIQTSTLTPQMRFGAGTPEGAGGHVATGTFTLDVEVSVEPA